MLCSISQIIPFKGSKSVFDPVVQELQPHKFEVRSMQYAAYQQTFVVVSCDVSGEVYIHDINVSIKFFTYNKKHISFSPDFPESHTKNRYQTTATI